VRPIENARQSFSRTAKLGFPVVIIIGASDVRRANENLRENSQVRQSRSPSLRRELNYFFCCGPIKLAVE
jgi:hypothetical protein